MRLYLRQHSCHSKSPGSSRLYLVGFESARETGTGKPRWHHVPWDPGLAEFAVRQAMLRKLRKAHVAALRRMTGGKPGRPSEYCDAGILKYLGCYRMGKRIVERRAMAVEERARRRYQLLSPDWQKVLTEAEYVRIELQARAVRKRRNRLRLPWDADACRETLIRQTLAGKGCSLARA